MHDSYSVHGEASQSSIVYGANTSGSVARSSATAALNCAGRWSNGAEMSHSCG